MRALANAALALSIALGRSGAQPCQPPGAAGVSSPALQQRFAGWGEPELPHLFPAPSLPNASIHAWCLWWGPVAPPKRAGRDQLLLTRHQSWAEGQLICTCCPKTVSFHGERTSVVPPAPSCLPQPSPVKASSPGGGSSLCPGLCCSKGWRNGASSLLAVTGPGCGRRAALRAAASTFKGETTKKKKALP